MGSCLTEDMREASTSRIQILSKVRIAPFKCSLLLLSLLILLGPLRYVQIYRQIQIARPARVAPLTGGRYPVTRTRTFYSLSQVVEPNTERQTERNFSDCFQSVFVICQTYSDLLKLATTDPSPNPSTPEDPRGNGTPPLYISSLINHSYDYSLYRDFDYRACPLPCEYMPADRLQEATGVIIDGRFVTDEDFPANRSEKQIYVLTLKESPIHLLGSILSNTSKFKDQINLMSTYRVDSDILNFYNRLCLNDRPRPSVHQFKSVYENKSRPIAWFVSNCKTQSDRMSYVKELQKHIDVDIYGECGARAYKEFGTEIDFLVKTYKFYLSFENSLCLDYVTEKFFKLFIPGLHVIPVVRGGMDYDKYFPPNTFINAAHFKTPSDLARFLTDVGGDFQKYAVYLQAKDAYTLQPVSYAYMTRVCNTCSALHGVRKDVTSRYTDIAVWVEKDVCNTPLKWNTTTTNKPN